MLGYGKEKYSKIQQGIVEEGESRRLERHAGC
jgi:hypothetical protein